MFNHINHKMPIYRDCTLMEVMVAAIINYVVLTIIFIIFSKFVIGYIWPGYLLASVLFVFTTRFSLSKLQKLKYAKPYGYYQHCLTRKLIERGLIKGVFVNKQGTWTIQRNKNEK